MADEKFYLFTLDSHDLYGPFNSKEFAHDWAYYTYRTSYTLLHDFERWTRFSTYEPIKPNIFDVFTPGKEAAYTD